MMERLRGGPNRQRTGTRSRPQRVVGLARRAAPHAAGDAAALRARRARAGPAHAAGGPHPLPALRARRSGVVERVRGVDELPDLRRPRRAAPAEPVYAVAFRSDVLWGASDEPPWTVVLDLWESYLEEAA